MGSDAVAEFTDTNFESDVLQSSTPVLVDFWAPWCGPCKMIAPVIDELAGIYGDKLVVGKMNIDESPSTPAKFGIAAIPTVMVFKNGEPVHRFTGVTPKRDLQQAIDGIV